MVAPKLSLNSTKDYLTEIVEPNYKDFKFSPSVRTALNAAWPLWHIHEWYYWEQNPHGSRYDCNKYGDYLKLKYKNLLILKDIAEAAKHFNLTRKSVEVMSVKRAWRGHFNTGVFTNIPHSRYEVKTASGKYLLREVFDFAFTFWHWKVM